MRRLAGASPRGGHGKALCFDEHERNVEKYMK